MTPYYYITVNVMYGLKACRESFDSEIQTTVNKTWREFICGVSNQELRNDRGYPLICNGFQYGIISHAYRTKMQASETGSIDYQVRFLIVDYHRKWIYGVIAADNQTDTNDGSPYEFPRIWISILPPLIIGLLLYKYCF
ncbi:unnamed protein product [Aphis gossypii]|uniref:Uncharacterized protein n=2 Tax=Aphis gossypii TaxID=80765 RepID=A0A9P0JDW6_APHGO|nr:unnamed protein product [Aphis gossypii]